MSMEGGGLARLQLSLILLHQLANQDILFCTLQMEIVAKEWFLCNPSAQREGMYDLQHLSQDGCGQLLSSHEADMEGMEADSGTVEKYFNDTQLNRITRCLGP